MSSNRLPVLAAEIKAAHAGVLDAAKTAAERAIEAGHALIEAKKLVKHGEWLPWLRDHCEVPERTAQLYMHIAKLGLESATVADLGLKGAAKAIVAKYPFPDPFSEGEETEQREWWLYVLFMARIGMMRVESGHDHVYWISRHGFANPDEWLGPDGRAFVATWGGRIDEKLVARWQSFLSEYQDKQASEIVAEIEQTAAAEPREPERKTRKRRRAA